MPKHLNINDDQKIIQNILGYSSGHDNYWSFKGRSTRHHCHALFQYPAMMVPQMQGNLIDAILNADTHIKTVYDPFVGSGTVLGEAMVRGLNFVGQDINPLAILACQVKSGPFYIKALTEKISNLAEKIEKDTSSKQPISFDGIDKWFSSEVQLKLNKIRRAIVMEKAKWARRFFWLSLSNTIRVTCNSRSSTYKLHIKSSEDIEKVPCPITYFMNDLQKNLLNIQEQKKILSEKKLLAAPSNVFYRGNIQIDTIDIRQKKISSQYDLLISSPPYGDNQTTVTYGQFSYLPLKWIDLKDIDSTLDETLLSAQNTIDSSSLGGSLKETTDKRTQLTLISHSFNLCANKIEKIEPKNVKKLTSFVFDLYLSMKIILNELRDNAYMVWTLGNRRISNIEVPLDSMLREILESMGCHYVYQLQRSIPNKRMASRNKVAKTMINESILIMRK